MNESESGVFYDGITHDVLTSKGQGMRRIRGGAPNHPQPQGKIERWH